jgi:hypothetical protein
MFMTEKQLISKIQGLRDIKPDQDWVVFTKERIMGKEEQKFSFVSFIQEIQKGERFVFNHKPAFAFLTVFIVMIGLFGFAQNSVPGDSLFTLKRITEQGVFVLESNQIKHDLALVDKRLDDLTKIAEKNEVDNLALAITEYQQTVSNAVESLTKENDPVVMKELAGTIKGLKEKEEKVKSLGIEIDENDKLDNVLEQKHKIIVEDLIKDWENSSLTEEKEQCLIEVKELYSQEKYSEALEKILNLCY